MNWSAIGYVTSGATLLAFVVASIAWLMSRALAKTKEIIETAPQSERENALRTTLESFSIDTTGLDPEAKVKLALEQLYERRRRLTVVSIVVVILACTSLVVTAYAMGRDNSQEEDSSPEQKKDSSEHPPIQTSPAISPSSSPERTSTVSPSAPRIRNYYAYASIEGNLKTCKKGRCRIRHHIVGSFEAPAGKTARFEDRLKTGGEIEFFRTVPAFVNLIPDQYPANKTYLEFAIDAPDGGALLQAQAELWILKTVTPEEGKAAYHLPYATDLAMLTVDLSHMGFDPRYSVKGTIEAPDANGVTQRDLLPVSVTHWNNNKVVIVEGRNLPANSNLIVYWDESSRALPK